MITKSRENKGVTLVELLVTSVIGVIIAGAIFSFVTFSGKATDEMAALQILQQESSMISELFMRKVRPGKGVCKVTGGSCIIPGGVEEPASHIRITYQDSTDIEFRMISQNRILEIDEGAGFRNISTRLSGADTSSHFIIQPYGFGVQLELILETKVHNKPYKYTETIGSVRCKNP